GGVFPVGGRVNVRLTLSSFACVLMAGTVLAAPAPRALAQAPEQTSVRTALDAAIDRVYPALVCIGVVAAYYRDGREVKDESSGSGVIISPDGYVITNHHVAGRAKRLRCTLSDKDEIPATLVGTDALADIAVIK